MSGPGAPSSPLTRTAAAAPPWIGRSLAFAARAGGAALALTVAAGETYDGTQLFALGLAAAVAASLLAVALPARLAPLAEALAAGTLFFSGALLWSLGTGMAMTALGAAAIAGTLIATLRAGRDARPSILAFFAGLALTVGWAVVVIAVSEG